MNVPQYITSLLGVLEHLSYQDVLRVQEALFEAWRTERTIFIAGNGGNAATASHFANDLNNPRPPGSVFSPVW